MKASAKKRGVVGLILAVVGSLLAFQNCAGFRSSSLGRYASLHNDSSILDDQGVVDPVSGYTVLPVPALCAPMKATVLPDLLKPVLATRNSACIMCHAQINGDVVFDFGYGDPFFLSLDDGKKNHPNQPTYGPFDAKHFLSGAGTWTDSSVMGNIYVPDTTLTDDRLLSAYLGPVGSFPPPSGGLTLKDFIQGSINDPMLDPTTTQIINFLSPSDQGYNDINTPGLRGKIIARKQIWIDAPSADELRTLKDIPTAVSVFAGLGLSITKSKPADVLVGLHSSESTNTHKLYAQNGELLTCRGDIIIDGTLFLNNLQLATDDQGCRLYVTGTVFMQGPVTYVNGGNSNLQISSATAIIIGMRSLKPRLSQTANQDQQSTPNIVAGVRTAWTDDEEIMQNTKIYNDRDSIDGLTDDAGPWETITDASGKVLAYQPDFDNDVWTLGAGVTTMPRQDCSGCTFFWAESFMRKSYDYKHMVLNAPKIYNRYYGTFTGVVIGEDVLFAVNKFRFQADPVFNKINLLPLVGDRIFSMSAE